MSDETADPVILPQSKRHKIFAYLGILIVLLAFGAPSGGLIDIPIKALGVSLPNQTATFVRSATLTSPSWLVNESVRSLLWAWATPKIR
jgi:hypothetical protein